MTTRYPQTILATCVVPWDDRERLLEDVFRREIRFLLAQNITHLYIFGTAGEGYAVDTLRFKEVSQVFWEETQVDTVHAQVGIMGMSTATIVERIGIAYDVGFRSFQISLPAWRELNDAEIQTFFSDVCGAFPDSVFLHYNLLAARQVLNGHHYRRLIDTIPNLVATKNRVADFSGVVDLLTYAPELQHFLSERTFPHGCLLGECSILPAVSVATPHKLHALFQAGLRQDIAEMSRLQFEIEQYTIEVLQPLLLQKRIDGAYDKLIIRLAGFEEMPLRLLSPYHGFSEEEYQQCKRRQVERYPDRERQE